MRLSLRYYLTAFALGFVWLLVLAATPGPASVIRGGTEEVYSLPRIVIWALFPVISVMIALAFRGWIVRCRGWRMLKPAVTLPWIGSLVIAVACGVAAYTLHRHPNGGFFGAVWYAVVYTITGFWIIAPIGLLSQWLLTLTLPRNSSKPETP
jgi:hypothetical protein